MDCFSDLQSFLEVLRSEGQLAEIPVPVDPHLELPEIHRRVIAAGGPALLFRKPKVGTMPVVTNLFGSASRVDRAFGPRPQAFVERVASLPHELMPPTLGRLWAQRDLLGDFRSILVSPNHAQTSSPQQRPPCFLSR